MTKQAVKNELAFLVADDLDFIRDYARTDEHSCRVAHIRIHAYSIIAGRLNIKLTDVMERAWAIQMQRIADAVNA